jgi:hypothetical protein
LYSFASKYCYFHNDEVFPLYDRYVDKLIWDYKQNEDGKGFQPLTDFERIDLKDYSKYINILNNLKQAYELTEYSIKKLDIFLWMYGKEWSNLKNENKKSK